MAKGLALVTGASGGLGLEFARLLAAGGWDLVLVARSRDKLEALATVLRAEFGVKADVVVMDLGVVDAADDLFARVPACDVLVNNAGFATNAPFTSIARGSRDGRTAARRRDVDEADAQVPARHDRAQERPRAQRRFDGRVSPRSVHGRVLRGEGVRPVVFAKPCGKSCAVPA